MSTSDPSLELGVIGNCEVAALIDEAASIVWCCLPALDGDPAFCALLSRDTGHDATGVFAVDLRDAARVHAALPAQHRDPRDRAPRRPRQRIAGPGLLSAAQDAGQDLPADDAHTHRRAARRPASHANQAEAALRLRSSDPTNESWLAPPGIPFAVGGLPAHDQRVAELDHDRAVLRGRRATRIHSRARTRPSRSTRWRWLPASWTRPARTGRTGCAGSRFRSTGRTR